MLLGGGGWTLCAAKDIDHSPSAVRPIASDIEISKVECQSFYFFFGLHIVCIKISKYKYPFPCRRLGFAYTYVYPLYTLLLLLRIKTAVRAEKQRGIAPHSE